MKKICLWILLLGAGACSSKPQPALVVSQQQVITRSVAAQCRTPALDREIAIDYWEKASSQDTKTRFKRWKSSGSKVSLNGLILDGDCDRFQTIANDETKTLVLNSLEGDVDEAVCIGQEIRRRKLNTEVNGLCLGPCFEILFLAGEKKRIEDGLIGMYPSKDTGRKFDSEKTRQSLQAQVQQQDLNIRMQMPDASEEEIRQTKETLIRQYTDEFREGFERYVKFKESLRIPQSFDDEFNGDPVNPQGQPVVIVPRASLLDRHNLPMYSGAPSPCLLQSLAGSVQFIMK